MTKFTAILAAAMLAIGFAPAATAVCNEYEIGIGYTPGSDVSHALHPSIIIADDGGEQPTYFIFDNSCDILTGEGRSGNVCGKYSTGRDDEVYCQDGNSG